MEDEEARWARLDAAMERVDAGDFEGAERIVRAYIEAYPDDEAGPAALAYLEDVRSGRVATPEAAERADEAAWVRVENAAAAFRCLNCGHARHKTRQVLLNSRLATFFGLDDLNRSTDCLICQTCGLIHWFSGGERGVYQALHAAHPEPSMDDEPAGEQGCMVCGHADAEPRRQLLNTPLWSLLGLDFLNEQASALRCRRCGHLHWGHGDPKRRTLPSRTWKPPFPPLDAETAKARREHCLVCGGGELEGRHALLNTRLMTRFNLDWFNRPAAVVRCRDCAHMSWFVEPKPGATDPPM